MKPFIYEDIRATEREEFAVLGDVEHKLDSFLRRQPLSNKSAYNFEHSSSRGNPTRSKSSSQSQGQPLFHAAEGRANIHLRSNTLSAVSPFEKINICPQHLLSLLRPMLLDSLKEFFRQFKAELLTEVNSRLKEALWKQAKMNLPQVEAIRRMLEKETDYISEGGLPRDWSDSCREKEQLFKHSQDCAKKADTNWRESWRKATDDLSRPQQHYSGHENDELAPRIETFGEFEDGQLRENRDSIFGETQPPNSRNSRSTQEFKHNPYVGKNKEDTYKPRMDQNRTVLRQNHRKY